MPSAISRICLAVLVLATLALGLAPVGAWAAACPSDAAGPCASTESPSDPPGTCCGDDGPCCCVEAPAGPLPSPDPSAPARSGEGGAAAVLLAPAPAAFADLPVSPARAASAPASSLDRALTGFAASPAERRLHLRQAVLLD